MNKEKALLPPTILAAVFPQLPSAEKGLPSEQAPSAKDVDALKNVIAQLQEGLSAAPRERGILALQQIRVMDEQQRMLRELMELMDSLVSRQLETAGSEPVGSRYSRVLYDGRWLLLEFVFEVAILLNFANRDATPNIFTRRLCSMPESPFPVPAVLPCRLNSNVEFQQQRLESYTC